MNTRLQISKMLTESVQTEIVGGGREGFVEGLLDLVPGIMYIYDTVERKNVFSNDGIRKMLGYPVAEIQEMGSEIIPTLMHPDDLALYVANVLPRYGRASDGEQIVNQYRMKNRSGGWQWIESTEVIYKRLPDGSPKQIFGVGLDITERKVAEEALRESEEKFSKVFRDAPIWIAITDMGTGAYLEVNDHLLKETGFSRTEMIGRTAAEIGWIRQEDRTGLVEEIRKNGNIHGREMEFGTKDGSRMFGLVNGEQITFGGRLCLLKVITNLTAKRLAELSLHRINRELKAITNCNQVMMRMADESTLLEEISRIVCDEAGYRMAWVGYANHDDAKTVQPIASAGFDDGYLEGVRISWAEDEHGQGPTGSAIRTGKTVCCQDYQNDIRMAPWLIAASERGFRSSISLPLKDAHESTFGALTIYSEVANAFHPDEVELLEKLAEDMAFGIQSIRAREERASAEENLKTERTFTRNLMATSPVGIVTLDGDGILQYANSRATQILGLPESGIGELRYNESALEITDLAGRPVMKDALPFDQVMSTGKPVFDVRHAITGRDGSRIALSINAAPLFDHHGEPNGMIASIEDMTARLKVEEELRETKAILQAAMDQSPVGIAIAEAPSGRLRYMNQAALRIRGIDAEKAVAGVGIDEYLVDLKSFDLDGSPLDFEDIPLVRALLNGENCSREFIIRRKDNEDRIVLANASPLRDVDGCITGGIAIFMDITEAKRAEVALQESEFFFKESQRASQTGSYKLDFRTGLWESSEVLSQIFGIGTDYHRDVQGWVDLIYTDDRGMMSDYLQNLVVEKRLRFNKEYRVTRASDGDARWMHGLGELSFDGDGNALSMTGTIRDITEYKQAEAALRLSEERLTLATRAANIGVWDWDIVGDILIWDDSMYSLYGIRKEDFSGAYDAWLNVLHPEDREFVDGEIQAALEGEREYSPEIRSLGPDGTIRIIKAESKTIRDMAGKAVRMIGVNIDITEQKLVAQELERHRAHLEEIVKERTALLESANHELESFSYSVSHDLRAPLRHIDGFVEMLNSTCRQNLSKDGLHYLDVISASARRMGVLIDDLLLFSRTSRQDMREDSVEMNQVLAEVLKPIQEKEEDRRIEWIISDLPKVRGDHGLLRQVWANLVENAVKYSSGREVAKIEIGCQDGGSETIFTIRDNGAGFDMRYAGKLFGVFQRMHRQDEFEGTGIGLATVHRIISRHHGRIWADSTLGEGATFSFALPKSEGDHHV